MTGNSSRISGGVDSVIEVGDVEGGEEGGTGVLEEGFKGVGFEELEVFRFEGEGFIQKYSFFSSFNVNLYTGLVRVG
jgi:hypothetical protein